MPKFLVTFEKRLEIIVEAADEKEARQAVNNMSPNGDLGGEDVDWDPPGVDPWPYANKAEYGVIRQGGGEPYLHSLPMEDEDDE